MSLPYYEVDAFTRTVFAGNPAGVCIVPVWPPDERMQAIAAENNLSETAFVCGANGRYGLRWFTPRIEVDLCGHATLASAFVLLRYVEPALDAVRFETRSGELTVARRGDDLAMDLPASPAVPVAPPALLVEGLGATPRAVLASRDYLAVFDHERDVAALDPDFGALERLDRHGIIVTAPGADVDFVSRYFAPAAGIAEDPVTGSAHCTLLPYWSGVLGRTGLRARQISRRGGELRCELRGDRCIITGSAVVYLEGRINAAP